MSERIAVLESPKYQATVERLKLDPIIIKMEEEIVGIADKDLETWGFTQAALERYHIKGGPIGAHIGGPAEAIRQLRRERRLKEHEQQENASGSDIVQHHHEDAGTQGVQGSADSSS